MEEFSLTMDMPACMEVLHGYKITVLFLLEEQVKLLAVPVLVNGLRRDLVESKLLSNGG